MLARLYNENRWSDDIRLPALPEPRPRLALFFLIVISLTVTFLVWLLWRYVIAGTAMWRLPALALEALKLSEYAAALTISALWAILFWRRRYSTTQPRRAALTVEQLYALSPKAFEHYVAGLFRRKGYDVYVRGRSGDMGVDLELSRADGRRAIVQCKRYRHTIGPEIVRELFGAMFHEGAVHGFLVTTAGISDSAREWAASKPITLIDGATLVELVNSMALGDDQTPPPSS